MSVQTSFVPEGRVSTVGSKKVIVEGLEVDFRNVPGSGITRVSVGGQDAFAFDPLTASFVEFVEARRIAVSPNLPATQLSALRQALIEHCGSRTV